MAANIGLSKVFILDKYFKELQKFWETEKKLQGKYLIQIDLFPVMSLMLLIHNTSIR